MSMIRAAILRPSRAAFTPFISRRAASTHSTQGAAAEHHDEHYDHHQEADTNVYPPESTCGLVTYSYKSNR